ncbi:hypothetical protein [Paraburkholderia domus]|uniref:hypothetical protein n=1 Tax=Paraburkholderia domus TaxID=2793075 RepID=UPI001B289C8D|nr:hypothetical protein [Paraburkholderia domus]CAE6697070.1 hypothetical protein R75483_00649 [Paraburkholderia domus]
MVRLAGAVQRSKEKVQVTAVAKRLGLSRPEPWRNRVAKTKAVKATQSLVRAIFAKEPNLVQLERLWIFPDWFYNNLSLYIRGDQSIDPRHRLELCVLGYKQKFLSDDQLRDLGLLALVDVANTHAETKVVIREFQSRRDRVKRTFDKGIERLLNGLMPVKAMPIGAIGRGPTVPRAPKDAREMERNYSSWVAKIERLGGLVTTERWEPAWYEDHIAAEAQSIEDAWNAQWATIPDSEREFVEAQTEEFLNGMLATADAFPENDRRPVSISAWHPYNVRRLKLWFGGRDWSPWPHAIEDDWWASVGGDDWSDFLDEHDARLEARYLAAIEIEKARKASPPSDRGTLPN